MKSVLLAAAAGAALVFSASAGAVTGNEPTHAWVTDGPVYAVAATPREVLVGGGFMLIGRETGSWVGVEANGTVPQVAPVLYDTVGDAVSDGANGWFLLTTNQDEESSVVHMLPDRSLDSKWHVIIDGQVEAIARFGATLYVAGDFTKVGGERHARVAGIDIATHKALRWDARVSAKKAKDYADVNVLEVSSDGSTLYFAGDFALVRDNQRAGLAAVSTGTGKDATMKLSRV